MQHFQKFSNSDVRNFCFWVFNMSRHYNSICSELRCSRKVSWTFLETKIQPLCSARVFITVGISLLALWSENQPPVDQIKSWIKRTCNHISSFVTWCKKNPRPVLDSWIPSLCSAQVFIALLVGFSADRTSIWLILTSKFLIWSCRINNLESISPSFGTEMDQNSIQTDTKLTEVLWKNNLMRYRVLYKLGESGKWRNLWNQLRTRKT